MGGKDEREWRATESGGGRERGANGGREWGWGRGEGETAGGGRTGEGGGGRVVWELQPRSDNVSLAPSRCFHTKTLGVLCRSPGAQSPA